MRGSSASTISAVTRVAPAVSLWWLAGSVATSAISTHRSRSTHDEQASSSPPGVALGPGHPEDRLRLVDGAVGLGSDPSLGTRPP